MSTLKQRKATTTTPTTSDKSTPTPTKSPSPLPTSSPPFPLSFPWITHSVLLIVLCLLPIRILSALYTPIPDCDETFNYWEPIHFIVYGRGLQTWEYSPVYGLRSYLYILFHTIPIQLLQILGVEQHYTKIGIFYAIRCLLGFISSICEARLIYAVQKRCGPHVASLFLIFQMFTPGMFHASIALLPQSFTMYSLLLCWTHWLSGYDGWAIFYMGVCALIGWPFSVVLGIPMGLDILWRYRKALWKPVIWGIVSAAACIIPSLLVDYHYYHKWFLAVINIAIYNGNQAAGEGANLYGVEPASYYIMNLALNFNIVIILALLTPIAVVLILITPSCIPSSTSDPSSPLTRSSAYHMVRYLGGATLWLILMFRMAHKEERFLIVIYPFINWSAAYATYVLFAFIAGTMGIQTRKRKNSDDQMISSKSTSTSTSSSRGCRYYFFSTLLLLAVLLFQLVSISRILALIYHYRAPFVVYNHLSHHIDWSSSSHDISVCTGKEWYRFPSHFFLPTHPVTHQHTRLQYLPSDFDGQLPAHYAETANATWIHPPHMNDRNRAEPTRYTQLHQCDYIVDLDLEQQNEPHYHEMEHSGYHWDVMYEYPFLDASHSPSWSRAFYIPYITDKYNKYRPYQALKRRRG